MRIDRDNCRFRAVQNPKRITPLPREYRTADPTIFFRATYNSDKTLFSTLVLAGLGELEVVFPFWTDVSFDLSSRLCV